MARSLLETDWAIAIDPARRDGRIVAEASEDERAGELGVPAEAIAIDPGLDFDLDVDHALEILRRLGELRDLGRPIFMSLSRKDFVGALLAGSWEGRAGAGERGAGTLAAAALAVAGGAEIHRLHDVEALDAIRVAGLVAHGATLER